MTTPTCPNCGAKFSHDSAMLVCKRCGIPDEIVHMGPVAIARWKKDLARRAGVPKRMRKVKRINQLGRKKNKHGRRGVRR